MIDRVKKLLEVEQLSPSQFADEIDFKRSSLSHVLSGRNKPSLDFVMKIKQRFNEVNLDWLIFGKGLMFLSYREKEVPISPTSISKIKDDVSQKRIEFDTKSDIDLPNEKYKVENISLNIESNIQKASAKSTNKVMIFYNDGTFEEFVKGIN